ncbi:MAG TPA: EAL domain-containing protein [Rheinheimera sp.]|uniref:EAL domain-containing protein n=1 Tax=Rheinheimera sp. TaxID=1869214 RepID=UPI002B46BBCA|nr:EAL domain-containing protein [Rheinheimera sp.]HJS14355.1 EAL domain-containing protein [Rheinheimera sp.]
MLLNSVELTESKILIVDDTLSNVLVLKEILSGCGSIYFSETAKDALELIPLILPDVILLDIEMPDMDGWQLCRILQKDKDLCDIPIVFITGHENLDFERMSLEMGGLDFIHKPFHPAICKLRVTNQLKLRRQSQLIAQGREQLQKLVKQVPVLITYWSPNWFNLFSNDFSGAWFELLDAGKQKLSLEQMFPLELSSAIKLHSEEKEEHRFQVQTHGKQGCRFFQIFQSAVYKNNRLDGYLVTLVDITEVKQAKQALYSEKERLRVTLNSIGDAVVATDTEGHISFMNPIAERMTGWRFRDAIGIKIEEVMPLRDGSSKQPLTNPLYIALRERRTVAMALNSELITRNGHAFAVEDSAAPIRNEAGDIIGAIMVFHDVSETMAMAIKMSHLANHDQLTDLPNRILLQDRLTVSCASAQANHTKSSVILIDIDHFKYLNDSLGHQLGDELIRLMAQRLKNKIPQSYTLARLGGDEFVILMNEVSSAEAVSAFASNLLGAMHEQFKLAEQYYSVSVSAGISIYPDDASSAEDLMRHADVAMYKAKQEGRNRFSFFSDELETALLQRHQLEKVIRQALSTHELLVYYQPKFDLNTKQLVGAEALARLVNDEGNFISPAEFIPLAEESGLILELGKQVLNRACAVAKTLAEAHCPIAISVNVAAAQFASATLYQDIQSTLSKQNLAPELLELEITETALMLDALATQAKLEQLKSIGVSISIDDFGTGYSSLSYLKKFNVDIMKIDMSFVKDMLTNKHDYEIVKTIISLGLSMGLKLVAEGVETQAQSDALVALNCQTGQGYLYSKPLPEADFVALVLSTIQR